MVWESSYGQVLLQVSPSFFAYLVHPQKPKLKGCLNQLETRVKVVDIFHIEWKNPSACYIVFVRWHPSADKQLVGSLP